MPKILCIVILLILLEINNSSFNFAEVFATLDDTIDIFLGISSASQTFFLPRSLKTTNNHNSNNNENQSQILNIQKFYQNQFGKEV